LILPIINIELGRLSIGVRTRNRASQHHASLAMNINIALLLVLSLLQGTLLLLLLT